jgi:hypothetical protein
VAWPEFIACVHDASVRIDATRPGGARLILPIPPGADPDRADRALAAQGWLRITDWVIEDGHAHARLTRPDSTSDRRVPGQENSAGTVRPIV